MAVENLITDHTPSYDCLLILFSLIAVLLLVCQIAVASAEFCIFNKFFSTLRTDFYLPLFSSHLPLMFFLALFATEPQMPMWIVLIIGIGHWFMARSAGCMLDDVLDPALT